MARERESTRAGSRESVEQPEDDQPPLPPLPPPLEESIISAVAALPSFLIPIISLLRWNQLTAMPVKQQSIGLDPLSRAGAESDAMKA